MSVIDRSRPGGHRHSRHGFVVTLAGAAVLLGAARAPAMGPPGPPGPPPFDLERRIETLDLDEAKRDEILAVLDAKEGERRSTRRALDRAHREMQSLLAAPASTADQIRAEAKKLDELEHTARSQHTELLLAVRALLPAELRGRLAPPPPRDGELEGATCAHVDGAKRGAGGPQGRGESGAPATVDRDPGGQPE